MYYSVRYKLGKIKLKAKEISLNLAYHNNFYTTQNYSELMEFRHKFQGQRCFIVGNAPSLNKMNLKLLQNEYCFLFNAAYKLQETIGLKKTFLAIEDRLVMEDHYKNLSNLKMPIFIPSDLRRFIKTDQIIETYYNRSFGESRSDWPPFVNLEQNKPVFYWGGTVGYYGLQLAHWMGFSEINIIGTDLSYSIPKDVEQKGSVITSKSDDPNHYDPSYFGAGKRWHVPQTDRMQRAFRCYEKFHKMDKVVRNAGVGGNLNVFERVEFESLF